MFFQSGSAWLFRLAQMYPNNHHNVVWRETHMFDIHLHYSASGDLQTPVCFAFLQHLCSVKRCQQGRTGIRTAALRHRRPLKIQWAWHAGYFSLRFKKFHPLSWRSPLQEGQGLKCSYNEMVKMIYLHPICSQPWKALWDHWKQPPRAFSSHLN